MIIAQFYRSSGNRLVGFSISGHADYAEYGQDIACASVSSAVMLTVNTLSDVFHADVKTQVLENDILLKLANDSDGVGDKLLLGLLAHLYLLCEEFPGAVKVEIVEK
jgi:uncharacterized protein YsxB (DUF464 family)